MSTEMVKNLTSEFESLSHEYEDFIEDAGKLKEPISIIIKNHLYIEFCLNQILKEYLPKSNQITERRRNEAEENFTFHQKLLIFDSLNLNFRYPDLVKKIKALNRIRNYFSHEISAEKNFFSEPDVKRALNDLYENGKFSLEDTEIKKIKNSITDILAALHALRIYLKFFPAYVITTANKSTLTREKVCKGELLEISGKKSEVFQIIQMVQEKMDGVN